MDRLLHKKDEIIDYSLYAFSDTLIITSSGDFPIEKILYELSVKVSIALAYGFPYGIFLRGSISIGSFYESEKMILGPAIDEAAQYYESANWIGIHLTPSAFSAVDRLISHRENSLSKHYKLYSVPIKGKKPLETYVVAISNIDIKEIFDRNKPPGATQLLEEERTLIDFIHYRLEHLTDVEGSDKWKNTLDYFKFMDKHFSVPPT